MQKDLATKIMERATISLLVLSILSMIFIMVVKTWFGNPRIIKLDNNETVFIFEYYKDKKDSE